VTIDSLLYATLAASGILAIWTAVRFPRLRTRSIGVALAVFLVGQILLGVGPLFVQAALELPYGVDVALFGVILPLFYVNFLACVLLLIAIASILGGPRGGHRIRLPGTTGA
jgi:hypothetical protein